MSAPRSAGWLVAAVLGATPTLVACEGKTNVEAKNAAPTFVAKDLEGEWRSLDDYEGQVVLLNFWATWCEPCKKELPELARLQREHGDRGLRIVAVSADVARLEPKVRRVVDEFGLPFDVWLDPEGKGQIAFKTTGYPTSFLIDRSGGMRWRRNGIITEEDPQMTPILESLLEEPAPAP